MNRRAFLGAAVVNPLQGQSTRVPAALMVNNPSEGVVSAKAFGAVGDRATDDTAAIQAAIDHCFGPASSPNGSAHVSRNKVLYFPPGIYRIATPLVFTKIHGARVLGAGRFVTEVVNDNGGTVFATNGCGYSHFEGLRLSSTVGGSASTSSAIVFNLDWDGSSGGAALQSNTFEDMLFYGGHFGIVIGQSRFMGSENLFMDCYWIYNSVAGLMTSNYNALQQTVVGGNFQSCGNGIWCGLGSVPVIEGVGFQQNTGYDIRYDSSSNNSVHVSGCRSESTNFIYAGLTMVIDACSHTSGTGANGDFAVLQGGLVVMSGCLSTHGRVLARYGIAMKMQSCQFNRSDWFAGDQLWYLPNNSVAANIELENLRFGPTGQLIRRRRMVGGPGNGDAGTVAAFDYVVNPAV